MKIGRLGEETQLSNVIGLETWVGANLSLLLHPQSQNDRDRFFSLLISRKYLLRCLQEYEGSQPQPAYVRERTSRTCD